MPLDQGVGINFNHLHGKTGQEGDESRSMSKMMKAGSDAKKFGQERWKKKEKTFHGGDQEKRAHGHVHGQNMKSTQLMKMAAIQRRPTHSLKIANSKNAQ